MVLLYLFALDLWHSQAMAATAVFLLVLAMPVSSLCQGPLVFERKAVNGILVGEDTCLHNAKDLRGQMIRADGKMSDGEARAFVRRQRIASVATVDANGWPYVIPLTYIYLDDDRLWLHTVAHQGHFLSNLENSPRVCVSVVKVGVMETAGEFVCIPLYTSVVIFGKVTIIRDDDRVKNWFFDRLREKYVPVSEVCPEYPDTSKIILCSVAIEIMTGKQSSVGH